MLSEHKWVKCTSKCSHGRFETKTGFVAITTSNASTTTTYKSNGDDCVWVCVCCTIHAQPSNLCDQAKDEMKWRRCNCSYTRIHTELLLAHYTSIHTHNCRLLLVHIQTHTHTHGACTCCCFGNPSVSNNTNGNCYGRVCTEWDVARIWMKNRSTFGGYGFMAPPILNDNSPSNQINKFIVGKL